MTIPEVSPDELRKQVKSFDIDLENKPVDGYADLGVNLNLNAMAIGLGLESVEYHPEEFPGLIYNTDNGTLLLFGGGDIFILSEDEEKIHSSVDVVFERLDDLGLLSGAKRNSVYVEIGPNTVPVPKEYDEIVNGEQTTEEETESDSPDDSSEDKELCPECDHPLTGDENFCPNCGAELEVTCSECGSDLSGDENFCSNCGAEVA